jgi:hypothetical protein
MCFELLNKGIIMGCYLQDYRARVGTYKKRLYSTLKMLSAAAAPLQEMRIVWLWSTTDWKTTS